MPVVAETRHHVPMHVRGHVPEACDVHLVSSHALAHGCLDFEDHAHELLALVQGQIRHLACVALEDHAHEARIVRLVHAHHAAELILPEHRAPGRVAKLTFRGGFIHQKGCLVIALACDTPSTV
ncbi:hypothetical protein D3C83_22620 [compost metagenome]